MYNICVFGGTTEGRELVEFLSAQPCNVTACVVTDYAQSLLPASGHVTVSAKKLPAGEIAAMLLSQRFDLVVDATHPYAQSITKSIARACRETGTQYVRLLRKSSAVSPDALYFETTEEAISFLRRTSGRILLTTGSKELSQYAAIEDFSNRVWARVLPLASSLDACQKAGLPPAHIFAMQGPFSAAMNATMLQSITAAFLVTKDGGAPGGFEEKAAGAKQAGAKLVVIGRPPEADAGLSLEETISTLCSRFGFPLTPESSLPASVPAASAFSSPPSARQFKNPTVSSARSACWMPSRVPGSRPATPLPRRTSLQRSARIPNAGPLPSFSPETPAFSAARRSFFRCCPAAKSRFFRASAP